MVLVKDQAGWAVPQECKAATGLLSPEKTWAFHVPMIVRLADGRVTEAF